MHLRGFLLLTLLILSLFNCRAVPPPTAKNGLIDLRNWDFKGDGYIDLEGYWEYFIQNQDFKENDTKKFYNLGNLDYSSLSETNSFASFKLKILLPEDIPNNSLFVRTNGFHDALAVSVGDKEIVAVGKFGNNKNESVPWMAMKIFPSQFETKEIELILSISNFYSRKLGFTGDIQIGLLQDLENLSNINYSYAFALILSFLLIFIYSIIQIKERIFQLSSLSSLSAIFLLATNSDFPVSLLFPQHYGVFFFGLRIICELLLFASSSYFFYLAFSSIPVKWKNLAISGTFIFYTVGLLITNHLPIDSSIEKFLYSIFLIMNIFVCIRIFLYGPSSFAKIKAYTEKYKSELDRTLVELKTNKKSFEQKLIERSFNMVTYMEKLEIQTNEMEKLNELIIHLLEGANTNYVLDEIFTHIMTYYRANIAFLYFIDKETNEFYTYRGVTRDIPEEIKNFMLTSRMPVSKEAGASYIAYKRKKTIYFENSKTKYTKRKEKGTEKSIPELVSSLYIPVLIRNEFQGIFFLATFNHALNLNKEKIKFISMFTNQLTAAIQKEKILKAMEEAKSRAESEREKAELARIEAEDAKEEIEAINSLAKSINENLELKYIMDSIMNYVQLHYGIEFYSLHILNESHRKMKILEAKFPESISSQDKKRMKQILIPIEGETGALSFIYKTKKMIFFKKLNLAKSSEEEKQALGNLDISSMVGIPLKVKGEIIGILNFFSQSKLNLTKPHLKTIANLGEQMAGVIHNSSLYKDIKTEKEKSESLLLSILPPKIANELKNTSKVVPVIYESVTILFTDFVGFTKIAESLLPKQLLIELDGYFTFFDFVSEKYNVEKLKTIGDAYMCAGGLPTANNTHAIDACLTAMEFRDFALRMQELNSSSKDEMMPWELRIGLHTGSVIGGIVGTTKFAYDVWGDSVNIASRIESSSIPGKINISETTYELVKDFFVCEHRGKVSAKNKGEIHMYFLSRLIPELSANEDGTAPNDKFHELYEKVKMGESIKEFTANKIPVSA